jgi:hypothetical protein
MGKKKKKKITTVNPTFTKLEKAYKNVSGGYSFGGPQKLKNKFPDVKLSTIKKFLATQPTYTLQHPLRKRFDTRSVRSSAINQIWGGDLMSMQNLTKHNRGYNYIMIFVDVLSKFMYTRPLKTKTPKEVGKAFLNIINVSGKSPGTLWCDKGTEFTGSPFKTLLSQTNIGMYHTGLHIKVSPVERVIRTLRNRIYRFFTANNTSCWVDSLEDITTGYNASSHRSIGMAPRKVNKLNIKTVLNRMYPPKTNKKWKKKQKFRVGDTVRVGGLKSVLSKEAYQSYSTEVFKITNIDNRYRPITYELSDLQNEKIVGAFYNEELVGASYDPTATYPIQKIIKTVGSGLRKKHLVRWLGYGKSFDSYVMAKDMVIT